MLSSFWTASESVGSYWFLIRVFKNVCCWNWVISDLASDFMGLVLARGKGCLGNSMLFLTLVLATLLPYRRAIKFYSILFKIK
jgi:hypothetical protein